MEQKWNIKRKGEYMDAILTMIIFKPTGHIGFNELERNLQTVLGLKISRPILSKYLKELVEKDIIKKEGIAWNTEYFLKEELMKKGEDFNKNVEKWTKVVNKQEEEFKSMDIDEQLLNIALNILLREFNILKIYITLDDRWKLYYLNSPTFLKSLETRVIYKSREDEKYKNDVINKINLFLEKLEKS